MAKFVVHFADEPPVIVDAESWELINGTTLHFYNHNLDDNRRLIRRTTNVFGPNSYWTTIERKEY